MTLSNVEVKFLGNSAIFFKSIDSKLFASILKHLWFKKKYFLLFSESNTNMLNKIPISQCFGLTKFDHNLLLIHIFNLYNKELSINKGKVIF